MNCVFEIYSLESVNLHLRKFGMPDFTVHTADQLPALLRAFRKQAGMTQAAAALRLGVTQQTLSAFERNAGKLGADRLLEILGILGVDVVLRQRTAPSATESSTTPDW